jgi:uncharacterized membrane protein YoaK (UPF0700 family)
VALSGEVPDPSLVDVDMNHCMTDPLVRALLALTFVTGIVDAVCFLGLGQVFAAMQTGNVLFLGFGLAGAEGAPVLAPLLGLSGFMLGGALAASIAARLSSRGDALAVARPVEAALLAGAALFATGVEVAPGDASAYVLIVGLSLAMGIRSTTTRSVGEENLATTVLNLSMASLASPTGLVGERDVLERGQALLAILAGALIGALLLQESIALALALAAGLTVVVRLGAGRAGRRAPSG